MTHRAKASEVCEMKARLVDCLKHEMDRGVESLDTDEAGKVADMIKDLAEAEYYCAVTEAMQGYDDDGSGYRPSRDAMGRYSRRRGYEEPDEDTPRSTGRHMPVGYRPGDPDMRMENWPDEDEDDRHGRAFREWRRARRHYTETHSEADKQRMREHENEHLAETMATVREMWDDSDPDMRKRMKADLTKLVSEMAV